jgi:hypothetical protein
MREPEPGRISCDNSVTGYFPGQRLKTIKLEEKTTKQKTDKQREGFYPLS